MIFIGIVFFFYLILNIDVTQKINKAEYVKEERKRLHKQLIWVLPFLGPWMIKGFWSRKKKENLEINTKSSRKLNKGSNTDNWQGLTGGGDIGSSSGDF